MLFSLMFIALFSVTLMAYLSQTKS